MKLLLDQNISFRVIKKLKEHFANVQSVKENKPCWRELLARVHDCPPLAIHSPQKHKCCS